MAKSDKEKSEKKKRPCVTKSDLAKALQQEYGGSLADNERWVTHLFDTLKDQLSKVGRAEIRGFGAFKVNRIKAHTTISPKKKHKKSKKYKKIKVPETYTVDFRTSKNYRDRLREDRAAAKPKTKKKASSKARAKSKK